jgi:hypothetical protein
MATTVVEDEPFQDAGEFLRAISPNGPTFEDHSMNRMLFRGQSDSRWPLIPSVLRAPRSPVREQVVYEIELLLAYYEAVDLQGLPIPSDQLGLKQSLNRFRDLVGLADGWRQIRNWPIQPSWHLAALAQHYGIQTRFLDWSRRAYVAAYFAAIEGARAGRSGKGASTSIAVWALDTAAAAVTAALKPSNEDHTGWLNIVEVPSAGVPNLIAQSGCFTVNPWHLTLPSLNRGNYLQADDKCPDVSLDVGLARFGEGCGIRKLTLSIGAAPRLLRLLAREGVSATTMFPGFGGAAKYVVERQLWDRKD